MEIIKNIPKERLVYIDESGMEDNACIEYGWSLKGQRCFGEKAFRHKRRVSMMAGLCNGEIMASAVFEGTCDTQIFETYVESILIKQLKPGQIVVMDNINFHKTDRVRALIESVRCKILFLPTYSPDLNPIEHYWFKIKHWIRKVFCNDQDLFEAVNLVFKKFTTSLS